MNTVARLKEFQGPRGISLEEESIPTPNKGEVLVKMKTAGLNRVENMIMHGRFPYLPELPGKVGFEGAGIVEKLGDGVQGINVGDEVSVSPNMDFTKYGVIANYAVVPATTIVEKPKSLNWSEAAGIWMGFSTAYAGIVNAANLKERKNATILISAASSSVGLPAIQIAKAHGAKVIATSRTLDKQKTLKELGADHVIATNNDEWQKQVADITSGKGFDVAFDPITGPFTTKLAEAAGFGATIVSYGTMSGEETHLPLFPMMGKGLKLTGIHQNLHLVAVPELFQVAKKHIIENLENGTYKVVLDKTFDLENIGEAYGRMESGNQIGKIIVEI